MLISLAVIAGLFLFTPIRYYLLWEKEAAGEPVRYAGSLYCPGNFLRITMEGGKGQPVAHIHFAGISKRVEWKTLRRRKKRKEKTEPESKPQKQAGGRRKFRIGKKIFGHLTPRELLQILHRLVEHFWKWLKPLKVRARLIFGTGNPMYTGLIYGLLWSVGIQQRLDREIRPDFLHPGLQGNVSLRGRVILGGLLWRGCYLVGFIITFILIKKIRIFTRTIYQSG